MPQNIPLNVGIIGCGNISAAYLRIAQALEAFNILACADINSDSG